MKKILMILTILIIILISLSLYWQKTNSSKDLITIKFGDKTKTFSMKELEKIVHEKVLTTRDDKIFSGFRLDKLFTGFQSDQFNSIYLTSSDGMSVMIKKDELSNAYLCLREKSDSKYYQLVITNDAFGQRWIKYIKLIELR